VGQPLDTVKVKMQTFPTMYRNAFDCFLKTFRQDGIYRGLYAGTVPSLAANVSENAVLFCFYGMCQKIVAFASGKNAKIIRRKLHLIWVAVVCRLKT
jgi:solute carrier family 25 ornithine transporter 2/15